VGRSDRRTPSASQDQFGCIHRALDRVPPTSKTVTVDYASEDPVVIVPLDGCERLISRLQALVREAENDGSV
jgi:hypothetical protein